MEEDGGINYETLSLELTLLKSECGKAQDLDTEVLSAGLKLEDVKTLVVIDDLVKIVNTDQHIHEKKTS